MTQTPENTMLLSGARLLLCILLQYTYSVRFILHFDIFIRVIYHVSHYQYLASLFREMYLMHVGGEGLPT